MKLTAAMLYFPNPSGVGNMSADLQTARELARLHLGSPFEIMKLTLTYEGPLGSNRGQKEKWNLRRAFHPQLEELWQVNKTLARAKHVQVPIGQGPYFSMENHHSTDGLGAFDPPSVDEVVVKGTRYRNLCATIDRHGKRYMPLVRESMALICGLDILFLRKEDPGALIKQGGDLDNRIKTLFDGLRMPSQGDTPYEGDLNEPFYCLLEEDSLISRFNVDTGRLLTKPGGDANEVKLIIAVSVMATQVRSYNLPLLGD